MTLVGIVENNKMALFAANVRNLFPLGQSWVDTGGVVCTRVQQHDRLAFELLEICQHTIEVQTKRLGVPIAIGSSLQTSMFIHREMIAPSWVGKENGGSFT